MVVNKKQKASVMLDVAVSNDIRNIRKKEHMKLEKTVGVAGEDVCWEMSYCLLGYSVIQSYI